MLKGRFDLLSHQKDGPYYYYGAPIPLVRAQSDPLGENSSVKPLQDNELDSV